jgi:hypothetical protein
MTIGLARKLAVAALAVVIGGLCTGTVSPAEAAPVWNVTAEHAPTNMPPGGVGQYVIYPRNVGDEPQTSPFTVVTELPPGVTATSATPEWSCDGVGTGTVTCTRDVDQPLQPPGSIFSGYALPIAAIEITVAIDGAKSGVDSASVTMSGGGAAEPATIAEPALFSAEPAGFGLRSLAADFFVSAEADAEPVRQAGSHPFEARYDMDFNLRLASPPEMSPWAEPDEFVRSIEVDLPPGLVGNPQAVPRCPRDRLAAQTCPAASQIGTVDLVANDGPVQGSLINFMARVPVYNMVPPRGVVADVAFAPPRFFVGALPIVHLLASLDPANGYAVKTTIRAVPTVIGIHASRLRLWGVPSDAAHDPLRYSGQTGFGAHVDIPPVPFLTMPADCGSSLSTSVTVDSWERPGVFETATTEPGVVGGCEDPRLRFEPSVDVGVDTTQPDAPTGLSVDIAFPQKVEDTTDPTQLYSESGADMALASPPLRDARIVLPEGMTVNPASADGLRGCSDEQIALGTNDPVGCPEESKIGSVSVETPVLADELEGSVYVGSQKSDDPASGDLFRLFMVLRDDDQGLLIKLAGKVAADPQTGRLTTSFDGNPQVPVSGLHVRLKGGPRAALATPATCGEKTVTSSLTSWNSSLPAATPSDSFSIDCPGLTGFAPSFEAGAVSATGGSFSPFTVRIERRDREEYLAGVSVEMPRGVLAKLKGVARCGEAQATSGGCSASSRIGTATVGAGAGSNPFHLQGAVHLTGPYKGAPLGMSVAVPVIAGPYDLGKVVVRQALHVDRSDVHVTVVSDPLPQIVKGVPVRLRSVQIDVDRPGFMINPSSCAEKQAHATFRSAQGSTSTASSRFQVGDCATLAFKPKLALRLTGKKQTRTGKHPGVKARVTQTGVGEAAIKQAVVRLPKSLALDPGNARALCEYVDGTKPDLENHCPRGSIAGRARVRTPLLARPLAGNVYFVKNVRRGRSGNAIRTLPMLVVALRGEIALNLRGETSTTRAGQLVNSFKGVPDAPINRFDLNINGGDNGILTVTRTARGRINLCAKRNDPTATVKMNGHNGKQADYNTRVRTPCTKKTGKRATRGR